MGPRDLTGVPFIAFQLQIVVYRKKNSPKLAVLAYPIIFSVQPSAPVRVWMEGTALLLTIVHVMWDGLEGSVKQVNIVESASKMIN